MAWQIDPDHSQVEFAVRHMMISTVRGRFTQFSGTVELDEADPSRSSVEVRIDAASIDTRAGQRDAHLQSPDFLNVAEYPYLVFKSKRVELRDATRARVIGDLTIRDITREVVLDVEYAGQARSPWGTTSAGFSAKTKINRKDWGLTWNQGLETGGVLVGDEISISIDLEVVQQAVEVEEAEAVAV